MNIEDLIKSVSTTAPRSEGNLGPSLQALSNLRAQRGISPYQPPQAGPGSNRWAQLQETLARQAAGSRRQATGLEQLFGGFAKTAEPLMTGAGEWAARHMSKDVFGEGTEDDSFRQKLARGIFNLPGGIVGSVVRAPSNVFEWGTGSDLSSIEGSTISEEDLTGTQRWGALATTAVDALGLIPGVGIGGKLAAPVLRGTGKKIGGEVIKDTFEKEALKLVNRSSSDLAKHAYLRHAATKGSDALRRAQGQVGKKLWRMDDANAIFSDPGKGKRFARHLGLGALEEGTEEGLQSFTERAREQGTWVARDDKGRYDGKATMKDLGESALLGALLGGPADVVIGGAQENIGRSKKAAYRDDLEALQSEFAEVDRRASAIDAIVGERYDPVDVAGLGNSRRFNFGEDANEAMKQTDHGSSSNYVLKGNPDLALDQISISVGNLARQLERRTPMSLGSRIQKATGLSDAEMDVFARAAAVPGSDPKGLVLANLNAVLKQYWPDGIPHSGFKQPIGDHASHTNVKIKQFLPGRNLLETNPAAQPVWDSDSDGDQARIGSDYNPETGYFSQKLYNFAADMANKDPDEVPSKLNEWGYVAGLSDAEVLSSFIKVPVATRAEILAAYKKAGNKKLAESGEGLSQGFIGTMYRLLNADPAVNDAIATEAISNMVAKMQSKRVSGAPTSMTSPDSTAPAQGSREVTESQHQQPASDQTVTEAQASIGNPSQHVLRFTGFIVGSNSQGSITIGPDSKPVEKTTNMTNRAAMHMQDILEAGADPADSVTGAFKVTVSELILQKITDKGHKIYGVLDGSVADLFRRPDIRNQLIMEAYNEAVDIYQEAIDPTTPMGKAVVDANAVPKKKMADPKDASLYIEELFADFDMRELYPSLPESPYFDGTLRSFVCNKAKSLEPSLYGLEEFGADAGLIGMLISAERTSSKGWADSMRKQVLSSILSKIEAIGDYNLDNALDWEYVLEAIANVIGRDAAINLGMIDLAHIATDPEGFLQRAFKIKTMEQLESFIFAATVRGNLSNVHHALSQLAEIKESMDAHAGPPTREENAAYRDAEVRYLYEVDKITEDSWLYSILLNDKAEGEGVAGSSVINMPRAYMMAINPDTRLSDLEDYIHKTTAGVYENQARDIFGEAMKTTGNRYASAAYDAVPMSAEVKQRISGAQLSLRRVDNSDYNTIELQMEDLEGKAIDKAAFKQMVYDRLRLFGNEMYYISPEIPLNAFTDAILGDSAIKGKGEVVLPAHSTSNAFSLSHNWVRSDISKKQQQAITNTASAADWNNNPSLLYNVLFKGETVSIIEASSDGSGSVKIVDKIDRKRLMGEFYPSKPGGSKEMATATYDFLKAHPEHMAKFMPKAATTGIDGDVIISRTHNPNDIFARPEEASHRGSNIQDPYKNFRLEMVRRKVENLVLDSADTYQAIAMAIKDLSPENAATQAMEIFNNLVDEFMYYASSNSDITEIEKAIRMDSAELMADYIEEDFPRILGETLSRTLSETSDEINDKIYDRLIVAVKLAEEGIALPQLEGLGSNSPIEVANTIGAVLGMFAQASEKTLAHLFRVNSSVKESYTLRELLGEKDAGNAHAAIVEDLLFKDSDLSRDEAIQLANKKLDEVHESSNLASMDFGPALFKNVEQLSSDAVLFRPDASMSRSEFIERVEAIKKQTYSLRDLKPEIGVDLESDIESINGIYDDYKSGKIDKTEFRSALTYHAQNWTDRMMQKYYMPRMMDLHVPPVPFQLAQDLDDAKLEVIKQIRESEIFSPKDFMERREGGFTKTKPANYTSERIYLAHNINHIMTTADVRRTVEDRGGASQELAAYALISQIAPNLIDANGDVVSNVCNAPTRALVGTDAAVGINDLFFIMIDDASRITTDLAKEIAADPAHSEKKVKITYKDGREPQYIVMHRDFVSIVENIDVQTVESVEFPPHTCGNDVPCFFCRKVSDGDFSTSGIWDTTVAANMGINKQTEVEALTYKKNAKSVFGLIRDRSKEQEVRRAAQHVKDEFDRKLNALVANPLDPDGEVALSMEIENLRNTLADLAISEMKAKYDTTPNSLLEHLMKSTVTGFLNSNKEFVRIEEVVNDPNILVGSEWNVVTIPVADKLKAALAVLSHEKAKNPKMSTEESRDVLMKAFREVTVEVFDADALSTHFIPTRYSAHPRNLYVNKKLQAIPRRFAERKAVVMSDGKPMPADYASDIRGALGLTDTNVIPVYVTPPSDEIHDATSEANRNTLVRLQVPTGTDNIYAGIQGRQYYTHVTADASEDGIDRALRFAKTHNLNVYIELDRNGEVPGHIARKLPNNPLLERASVSNPGRKTVSFNYQAQEESVSAKAASWGRQKQEALESNRPDQMMTTMIDDGAIFGLKYSDSAFAIFESANEILQSVYNSASVSNNQVFGGTHDTAPKFATKEGLDTIVRRFVADDTDLMNEADAVNFVASALSEHIKEAGRNAVIYLPPMKVDPETTMSSKIEAEDARHMVRAVARFLVGVKDGSIALDSKGFRRKGLYLDPVSENNVIGLMSSGGRFAPVMYTKAYTNTGLPAAPDEVIVKSTGGGLHIEAKHVASAAKTYIKMFEGLGAKGQFGGPALEALTQVFLGGVSEKSSLHPRVFADTRWFASKFYGSHEEIVYRSMVKIGRSSDAGYGFNINEGLGAKSNIPDRLKHFLDDANPANTLHEVKKRLKEADPNLIYKVGTTERIMFVDPLRHDDGEYINDILNKVIEYADHMGGATPAQTLNSYSSKKSYQIVDDSGQPSTFEQDPYDYEFSARSNLLTNGLMNTDQVFFLLNLLDPHKRICPPVFNTENGIETINGKHFIKRTYRGKTFDIEIPTLDKDFYVFDYEGKVRVGDRRTYISVQTPVIDTRNPASMGVPTDPSISALGATVQGLYNTMPAHVRKGFEEYVDIKTGRPGFTPQEIITDFSAEPEHMINSMSERIAALSQRMYKSPRAVEVEQNKRKIAATYVDYYKISEYAGGEEITESSSVEAQDALKRFENWLSGKLSTLNRGKANGSISMKMLDNMVRDYYSITSGASSAVDESFKIIDIKKYTDAVNDIMDNIDKGRHPQEVSKDSSSMRTVDKDRIPQPYLPVKVKHALATLYPEKYTVDGLMGIEEELGNQYYKDILTSPRYKEKSALRKMTLLYQYSSEQAGHAHDPTYELFSGWTLFDFLMAEDEILEMYGFKWTPQEKAFLDDFREKEATYLRQVAHSAKKGKYGTHKLSTGEEVRIEMGNLTNAETVALVMADTLRAVRLFSPFLGLVNMGQRVKNLTLLRAELGVQNILGLRNTEIIKADGYKEAAKAVVTSPVSKAWFKLLTQESRTGNRGRLLDAMHSSSITPDEYASKYLKGNEKRSYARFIKRTADYSARMASGWDIMSGKQNTMMMDALASWFAEEHPLGGDPESYIKAMTEDPDNFLRTIVKSGGGHLIEKAFETVHRVDDAGTSIAIIYYNRLLKALGPWGDLGVVTTISSFPRFALQQLTRFGNGLLPLSAIGHVMRTRKIQKAKDAGTIDSLETEWAAGLTEQTVMAAFALDAMRMGRFWTLVAILLATDAIEPPDDEDKDLNSESWKFCGIPLDMNWWLADMIGLPFYMAMALKEGDMGIFFHNAKQCIAANPAYRLSPLIEAITDMDEITGKDMDELMADAEWSEFDNKWRDGVPSKHEYMWTKYSMVPASLIAQFGNLALIRDTMNLAPGDRYEKSSNRVYMTDANGDRIIDPTTGTYKTEYTTFRDAQWRKWFRNKPVISFFTDLIAKPDTPYAKEGRPDTVFYDEAEMVYVQTLSMYDDQGNEVSQDVKDQITMTVVDMLRSVDDIEELNDNNIVIPYDTKKYVGDQIMSEINTLESNFSEFQGTYGGNRQALGSDYESGNAYFEEIKRQYKSDIEELNTLYYDKLWNKDLKTFATAYNRLESRYLQDANGEWYASGSRPGLLSPFLWKYDDDTYDFQARYDPQISDSRLLGSGSRGFRPVEPTVLPRPDEDGSDLKYGTAYNEGDNKFSEQLRYLLQDADGSGSGGSGGYGGGYSYYKRGGRGGYGGGGSSYQPNIYSNAPRLNFDRPNTMRTSRVNRPRFDYLRPSVETKGSREAYKRGDL